MSARIMRAIALATLALAVCAPAARAQKLEGRASASQLSYRFSDSTGTGQQSGQMLGAALSLGLGQFRIAASGAVGRLADADHAFAQRELRTTLVSVGVEATRWMEVGLEMQARREVVSDVVTLQRLAGPYGKAAFDFGGTGLQGLAELALYPASSSSNTPPLQLALRAGIGARYQQLRGPLTAQLMYRFNRLDYKAQGGLDPSLTQDESISIELGLRKF